MGKGTLLSSGSQHSVRGVGPTLNESLRFAKHSWSTGGLGNVTLI